MKGRERRICTRIRNRDSIAPGAPKRNAAPLPPDCTTYHCRRAHPASLLAFFKKDDYAPAHPTITPAPARIQAILTNAGLRRRGRIYAQPLDKEPCPAYRSNSICRRNGVSKWRFQLSGLTSVVIPAQTGICLAGREASLAQPPEKKRCLPADPEAPSPEPTLIKRN